MKHHIFWLLTVFFILAGPGLVRAQQSYSFGVLSQRSAVLTAEHWNPILAYAGRKAGVALTLKVERTAPESNAALTQGEYDFVYSNTIFMPALAPQNYQVILRPRAGGITGQIVTLIDSPIHALSDLEGKVVGFPSKAAFVGYAVPMDHLLRKGVRVEAVFGGNQEGVMAQLKAGRVGAAAVNDEVMATFAAREGVKYRVLWTSPSYHNLPVAAHPRVPKVVAEAVRDAIAGMNDDPEGRAVLAEAARVIGQKPPFGFMPASQADYRNYLDFYRHTRVRDIE